MAYMNLQHALNQVDSVRYCMLYYDMKRMQSEEKLLRTAKEETMDCGYEDK